MGKFNSKTKKIREDSAFFKHLQNQHKGRFEDKICTDYFEVKILKAYQKPFTRCVEEGIFISTHEGEILNSKSE